MRLSNLVRLATVIGIAFLVFGSSPASASPISGFKSCSYADDTFANADGSMFVLGTTRVCSNPSDSVSVLFKLKQDGSVDESWNEGGFMYLHGIGAVTAADATDGILTFATRDATHRFNADGSPDASFGTGGEAQIGNLFGGRPIGDMAVDSQGRVVLLAEDETQATVARLGANGQPDGSFGTGGVASPTVPSMGFTEPTAVAVDGSDRVTIAGKDGGLAAVMRLLANGDPDTSFGPADDGYATHPTPLGLERVADAFATEDGSVQVSLYGVNTQTIYCDYGHMLVAWDADGGTEAGPRDNYVCGTSDVVPVIKDGRVDGAFSGSLGGRGAPSYFDLFGLVSSGTGWSEWGKVVPGSSMANSVEYLAESDRVVGAGYGFGGDCGLRPCPVRSKMIIRRLGPDRKPDTSFGIDGTVLLPKSTCRFGESGDAPYAGWRRCRVSKAGLISRATVSGRRKPSLTFEAEFASMPVQPGAMAQRIVVTIPPRLRQRKPLRPGQVVATNDGDGEFVVKTLRHGVMLTLFPRPGEYELTPPEELRNVPTSFELRIKRGALRSLPRKLKIQRLRLPVRSVLIPRDAFSDGFVPDPWYSANPLQSKVKIRKPR